MQHYIDDKLVKDTTVIYPANTEYYHFITDNTGAVTNKLLEDVPFSYTRNWSRLEIYGNPDVGAGGVRNNGESDGSDAYFNF